MITKKYYKLVRVSYEDLNYLTFTNTSNDIGGFSASADSKNLEYSLNGVDWTNYDLGAQPIIEVQSGGHIYLRGNNPNGFDSGRSLKMNVEHAVSGNLFSLRNPDPTVFSTYTTVLNREFYELFRDNTNLTDASGLVTSQITSVGELGFRGIFWNCTSLVSVPDFSGVTNVGYTSFNYAFHSAKLITETPDFRNIINVGTDSFIEAFAQCRKLNTVYAPNVSSWDTSVFNNWLVSAGSEVSTTKTFYAPEWLSIPTDNNSGIPSGWTRVDY